MQCTINDNNVNEAMLNITSGYIDLNRGAVIINVNHFGHITPVIIDTLIPNSQRMIFSSQTDKSKSAWFSLVEKALNKLFDYIPNH